jgi:hypothetical protein
MIQNFKLDNVTLLAMTSIKIDETIKTLMFSSKNINFAEVKLITHEKPHNLPSKIKYEHVENITDVNKYSYNMVFNLADYIQTDFVLVIQHDGFVVNSNSWREEFLNYDYIGGAWNHKHFIDRNGKQIRIGNGGASLRSKKLLEIPKKHNMKWMAYDGNFNEDTQICVWNRNLFLDNGVVFADFDVSKYFSHEEIFPEYNGIDPFCFHNFGGENQKYKKIIDSYNIEYD